MIRFFIGYDPVEAVAFHTYSHSILTRSSLPVAITPVCLNQLPLTRERDPMQSNDFAFSRWLVPWLCNYEGWAIFSDCDMLMLADVGELWNLRDDRYAVQVVKHNHVPHEEVKYLNNIQTKYPKKNWSSMMLLNCAKLRQLTPEYVDSAPGLDLHQFKWLDESLIGEIPMEWNFLVGYYSKKSGVKNLHYTEGGPYFREYMWCDYASDWQEEFMRMTYCKQREEQ